MLVEEPLPEKPDVVFAVEYDGAIDTAYRAIGVLHRSGISAEMVATGSPRKRYDKAVRLAPKVLIAFQPGSPIVLRSLGFQELHDKVGTLLAEAGIA